MKIKTTVLFALLMPGVAMLAACNPTPDADDAAMAPSADATNDPPAVDTMPADPMPPMPDMTGDERTFAQMDANQDGGITQDELSPGDMLHEHFSVADANGDGMLSEDEVAQHRADMAAAPAN